jgi:Transposase IS200 like
MSRFERASHVIWHRQYHLGQVPKYRFRMLQGPIGREVQRCVMMFCQQLGCEIVEMNVGVPPSGGHRAKPRSTNVVHLRVPSMFDSLEVQVICPA